MSSAIAAEAYGFVRKPENSTGSVELDIGRLATLRMIAEFFATYFIGCK